MLPNGVPEPEENSLLRMVGRLRAVGYGHEPNKYEFEIESVVSDIDRALVAPYLGHAIIADGIRLPEAGWQQMTITIKGFDDVTGQITSGTQVYTVASDFYDNAEGLKGALNDAFVTTGLGVTAGITFQFQASIVGDGDARCFSITAVADVASSGIEWIIQVGFPPYISNGDANPGGVGLAAALGWGPGDNLTSDIVTGTSDPVTLTIAAPKPVPRVFIPTRRTGGTAGFSVGLLSGTNGFSNAVGDQFFTDQGDGSGLAYVRLFDGQVLNVISKTATALTLSDANVAGRPANSPPFFYCQSNDNATIEQVIHLPSGNTDTAELGLFQLLASKGYDGDSGFNVFPEGVGLGLGDLVGATFSTMAPTLGTSTYAVDIDRTMKFSDLWQGVSKLFGLFIVWDVENSELGLRAIKMPSSTIAGTFEFSESNRSTPGDRTKVDADNGNIRTGWTVKYGWNYKDKKFEAPEFTINDNFAMSAFGTAARTETIEDRMVPASATSAAVDRYLPAIINRSLFTRDAWARLARSVNKTGLLLTPGNFHKLIDNTIINPFTGTIGIVSTDEVYCFVYGVRMNLEKGEVQATILIDRLNDATVVRPWAPTGLVDFGASYNGYSTTTGILTMDRWYTKQAGMNDAIDFLVGDKVKIISRQNEGAPGYEEDTTVSAIAADGSTMTVDTGLTAAPPDVELIVVLQDWSAQTTARKTTAATRVTFQGDGDTMLIDGDARLHRWT